MKEDVWIKSFCHGCLNAVCGMMVHRVDGVVVGMQGDPDNPYNRGKLCAKAYGQIMTLYDPYRPSRPLIRTNPEKGMGIDPRWREVSWEEAFDIAARKLAEIYRTNPADLFLSYFDISAINWVPPPILTSFGSPNWSANDPWCGTAVHTVPYQTMGCFHCYPDYEYCNYLVLWGSNKGGVVQMLGTTAAFDVAEARIRRGMKLVCIDPVQSNIGAKANEWIPIRPGTDLALALAWLHVLLNEEGLYDAEHIKRYTNGPYLIKEDGHYLRDKANNKPMMWDAVQKRAKPYSAEFEDVAIEGVYEVGGNRCKPAFQILKEHVSSHPPEWATPITDIKAETIRRIAREFGKAACIGATINYEGYQLPYRPAAIHWYSGISQHVNGYITGIAIQLINTVVGNLFAVGGVSGESVVVECPYGPDHAWSPAKSYPDELDGMIVPSIFARFGGGLWPGYPAQKVESPKTFMAAELFPVAMMSMGIQYVNTIHPELFNNKIPLPKLMLGRHSSEATNNANPQQMERFLKNFYQISCEPLVDETAEFADIFFPAPSRLERLQVGTELPGYMGGTIGLSTYCINFSQPVVRKEEIRGREMLDIWIELAERAGFLPELNQAINVMWDLKGEYRLELDKKYTYEEMQDRFAKSMFGPEYDLRYLSDIGHLKWKKSVKERYPRPFFRARAPIYYEHFIDAGTEVARVCRELGFEGRLDVTDYKPLPSWRPGPAHREIKPGFDLIAIPFRLPFLSHMWMSHNPWLMELAEVHPWGLRIIINAKTASRHGIKNGDHVVVEAVTGYKVEGEVKLTECIHPEVVAISRHGGHWCSHPVAKNKGTLFNILIPPTLEYMDHIFPTFEGAVRVKVMKTA